MRETIIVRMNDHVEQNGIKEYTLEIAVPGTFNRVYTGGSQMELLVGLIDSFGSILTDMGIPKLVDRTAVVPEFTNTDTPQGFEAFKATAKATFGAEVYRNGVVVED